MLLPSSLFEALPSPASAPPTASSTPLFTPSVVSFSLGPSDSMMATAATHAAPPTPSIISPASAIRPRTSRSSLNPRGRTQSEPATQSSNPPFPAALASSASTSSSSLASSSSPSSSSSSSLSAPLASSSSSASPAGTGGSSSRPNLLRIVVPHFERPVVASTPSSPSAPPLPSKIPLSPSLPSGGDSLRIPRRVTSYGSILTPSTNPGLFSGSAPPSVISRGHHSSALLTPILPMTDETTPLMSSAGTRSGTPGLGGVEMMSTDPDSGDDEYSHWWLVPLAVLATLFFVSLAVLWPGDVDDGQRTFLLAGSERRLVPLRAPILSHVDVHASWLLPSYHRGEPATALHDKTNHSKNADIAHAYMLLDYLPRLVPTVSTKRTVKMKLDYPSGYSGPDDLPDVPEWGDPDVGATHTASPTSVFRYQVLKGAWVNIEWDFERGEPDVVILRSAAAFRIWKAGLVPPANLLITRFTSAEGQYNLTGVPSDVYFIIFHGSVNMDIHLVGYELPDSVLPVWTPNSLVTVPVPPTSSDSDPTTELPPHSHCPMYLNHSVSVLKDKTSKGGQAGVTCRFVFPDRNQQPRVEVAYLLISSPAVLPGMEGGSGRPVAVVEGPQGSTWSLIRLQARPQTSTDGDRGRSRDYGALEEGGEVDPLPLYVSDGEEDEAAYASSVHDTTTCGMLSDSDEEDNNNFTSIRGPLSGRIRGHEFPLPHRKRPSRPRPRLRRPGARERPLPLRRYRHTRVPAARHARPPSRTAKPPPVVIEHRHHHHHHHGNDPEECRDENCAVEDVAACEILPSLPESIPGEAEIVVLPLAPSVVAGAAAAAAQGRECSPPPPPPSRPERNRVRRVRRRVCQPAALQRGRPQHHLQQQQQQQHRVAPLRHHQPAPAASPVVVVVSPQSPTSAVASPHSSVSGFASASSASGASLRTLVNSDRQQ
ncbi:hypothetical protein DFJ73DRAFT_967441 [Zopfochytrium polystomum]|nr:hypothetical protein DFJ73DRAFT_967441 [Zopfochytrium polystomum]